MLIPLMDDGDSAKLDDPTELHDRPPEGQAPRPAVEPSAEPAAEAPDQAPDEARDEALRPRIDARVRPEAVPEPLVADPAVHRLLRRRHDRKVDPSRQVFVNRNLRMDHIEAVGFDMDYTLAVYHQRRIETLSYRMTLEGLVGRKGYPERLLRLEYDPDFVIRGLVVDKTLGNLLKMDRYAHVGRVYHGRRRLSKNERIRHYRTQKIHLSSDRYAWIDTLFALPEAVLYTQIIDDFEDRGESVDYARLYDDIRESIDLVHRDGSLKAVLKKDLDYYIRRDPEIAPTLHKLRSSGKRLFLLTNSYWDYTDAVMEHLLGGVLPEYAHWRSYFDLVVVGAKKPDFFGDHAPFYAIDPATGAVDDTPATRLENDGIYQGGHLQALEDGTGWRGDEVLYVGDHIYGDILKTKRSGLWRTAMIIQELEEEIAYTERRREDFRRLARLEDLRLRLDDEINVQKSVVSQIERQLERRSGALDAEDRTRLKDEWLSAKGDLDRLRRALKGVLERIERLASDLDHGANPYWGLLFKEATENSRFGDQVEDYACIYTSRVSNLHYTSPTQYFRSRRDRMAHEGGCE